ncbi:MAG: nicotinate phosphoribosyltransferase [Candidatus Azambacteria bacterium]|nr:nicotinate phosphoribosyltransferase [Candidatus Azambacteria bacterium]
MYTLVKRTDIPIIQSLLDLDLYKLTMGQFIWKNHQDVQVTYALTNRHADRVAIARLVDIGKLKEELAHVRTLRLTEEEKKYLLGVGCFTKEYVDFLATLTLPEVMVKHDGDQYAITATGPWKTAVYWETIILAVVNELIGKGRAGEVTDLYLDHGRVLLEKKIQRLRTTPQLAFVEFGTRRRFSFAWQKELIARLTQELPAQLAGTSNVHLAMRNNIKPVGTFAHEMTMVYAALAPQEQEERIRESHKQFLDAWWQMYGEPYSIALTDTWSADFFFETFTKKQALLWKGLRHDSGNPFVWGEKFLAFYHAHGIDPKEKTMLFSDGLDIEIMQKLYKRFAPYAKVAYGWGTNLTNDVWVPATSIVVKVVEVNGVATVKLSDNLAKAMGPKNLVKEYAKIFRHPGAPWERCAY